MKAHLLVELFAVADDGAARRRIVAVEVLRRAVHRDVGAELERPLEVRRQERIVDGVRNAVLLGDLRDRGDIRQLQRRIRRRLGEDQLRVGPNRLANGIGIRRIDERELHAEARVDLRRDAIRAAVRDVRDDCVIAGRECGLEHDLLRRHARRVARATLAVLEHRDLLLERAHGWVAAARVRESLRQILIDGVLHERRRLINRRENGARDRVGRDAGVNLLGREAHRLAPR